MIKSQKISLFCRHCQNQFTVPPSRSNQQFCSRVCKDSAGRTIQTIKCARCSKSFTEYPCVLRRGNRRFCSRRCYRPPVIVRCQRCGNGIRLKADKRRARPQHFCSRTCWALNLTGSNNPSFIHGLSKTSDYKRANGAKWRDWRSNSVEQHTLHDIRRQLARQHYRCFLCTKPLQKVGDKYIYHVDHWRPLSKSQDNSARNIRILHPKCNQRKTNKSPKNLAQEMGMLLLG